MSKNCPKCGGPTTRKGITVSNGPWKDKGATWTACLNCDWDSKDGDAQ